MINITRGSVIFEHEIGFSPCPQLAGTISITNIGEGEADGWQLVGDVPTWLSISSLGSLPGSVDINFSCVLEEYITQTLETSFSFQLTSQGQLVGNPASINVTGYISGEQ